MDPRWKKALWKKLPGALALALCALLVGRTVRELARAPALNADMLPAMALALEWGEDDPLEVHRRTYAAARAELPPERWAQLTGSGVLRARAEDPAAFQEHLPFFRSRVLYTLAIAALHALGAPLTAATYWIPIASFALCAALFFAWARAHLPAWAAALLALGLAHTPALVNQARFSSADGLGTLLACAGAWALVERRALALGAGLLVLAIAARPDAVLLSGCAALALYLVSPREERPKPRALAAWLAASAALVLALRAYSGEYGWWPLIQISFVGKSVHPAELPTAPDWGEYLAILGRQLSLLPGDGYATTPGGEVVTGSTLVFPYAAAALLGLGLARSRPRPAAMLAALLAAYAARWLLFPQLWDRFYAPFYALVPLCLLSAVCAELRARPRAFRADGGPDPAP